MPSPTPLRKILDSSRGQLRIGTLLGIASRSADAAPERQWPAFRAPQIMDALLAIDDAMALSPFVSPELAFAWGKPLAIPAHSIAKDAFSLLHLCAKQSTSLFAVDGLSMKCAHAKSSLLVLGLSPMEAEALMAHSFIQAGLDISCAGDNAEGLESLSNLSLRLMSMNLSRGLSNSILLELGVGMLGSAIFYRSTLAVDWLCAQDAFNIKSFSMPENSSLIFGWNADSSTPKTHCWAMDVLSNIERLWDQQGSAMDGVSHARLSAILRFHDEYVAAAKMAAGASVDAGGIGIESAEFPDYSQLRSILSHAASPEAVAGPRVAASAQEARSRLDGARLDDKITARRAAFPPPSATGSSHGM